MTGDQIKCRVMRAADYPEVYRLWLNTPGMGLNKTDDSAQGIEKYLKRNPTTSFVALDGSRIIGVIMAGHDGRRGYIHHTAVLPEYRGRHIGMELVRNAMNALEAEGISKVALVAFEKNTTGNAFWEHIGFSVRKDLVYRNRSIRTSERIDT